MKWSRIAVVTGLSAAVALSLIVGANLRAADKAGDPKEEEAAQKAKLVEDVGAAAGLAEMGRNGKWPDALVVAGGILMQVDKATGGKFADAKIEVKDGDGKVVADDTKATSFKQQASELFDEARAMVTDKDRSKALETQIKEASAPKDRGAIGGPRHITRTIGVHKEQTMVIPFEPNREASVSMRGTGGTQFEVYANNGGLLWHSQGTWGTYHWHTGHGGVKEIMVKVINAKGPSVAYEVDTN